MVRSLVLGRVRSFSVFAKGGCMDVLCYGAHEVLASWLMST